MVRVLLCGALLVLGVHPVQALGEHIEAGELRADHWSGGVIDNAAFTPGGRAAPPRGALPGHAAAHGSSDALETREACLGIGTRP